MNTTTTGLNSGQIDEAANGQQKESRGPPSNDEAGSKRSVESAGRVEEDKQSEDGSVGGGAEFLDECSELCDIPEAKVAEQVPQREEPVISILVDYEADGPSEIDSFEEHKSVDAESLEEDSLRDKSERAQAKEMNEPLPKCGDAVVKTPVNNEGRGMDGEPSDPHNSADVDFLGEGPQNESENSTRKSHLQVDQDDENESNVEESDPEKVPEVGKCLTESQKALASKLIEELLSSNFFIQFNKSISDQLRIDSPTKIRQRLQKDLEDAILNGDCKEVDEQELLQIEILRHVSFKGERSLIDASPVSNREQSEEVVGETTSYSHQYSDWWYSSSAISSSHASAEQSERGNRDRSAFLFRNGHHQRPQMQAEDSPHSSTNPLIQSLMEREFQFHYDLMIKDFTSEKIKERRQVQNFAHRCQDYEASFPLKSDTACMMNRFIKNGSPQTQVIENFIRNEHLVRPQFLNYHPDFLCKENQSLLTNIRDFWARCSSFGDII